MPVVAGIAPLNSVAHLLGEESPPIFEARSAQRYLCKGSASITQKKVWLRKARRNHTLCLTRPSLLQGLCLEARRSLGLHLPPQFRKAGLFREM